MKKGIYCILLAVLLTACGAQGDGDAPEGTAYAAPAYYANMYSGNFHTAAADADWALAYNAATDSYDLQRDGVEVLENVRAYFVGDAEIFYTRPGEDGTYAYTLSDGSTSKIADISCTELIWLGEDIYFTESTLSTAGKLYHKAADSETFETIAEEQIAAPFNLYPFDGKLYFCMQTPSDGDGAVLPTTAGGNSGFGGTGYDFGDIYCLDPASMQCEMVVSAGAVRRFLIEGQTLYYVNGTELGACDLKTGEAIALENAPYDVSPDTFTIYEGKILYSGMLSGATHSYDVQSGSSAVIAEESYFDIGLFVGKDHVYGGDTILAF